MAAAGAKYGTVQLDEFGNEVWLGPLQAVVQVWCIKRDAVAVTCKHSQAYRGRTLAREDKRNEALFDLPSHDLECGDPRA